MTKHSNQLNRNKNAQNTHCRNTEAQYSLKCDSTSSSRTVKARIHQWFNRSNSVISSFSLSLFSVFSTFASFPAPLYQRTLLLSLNFFFPVCIAVGRILVVHLFTFNNMCAHQIFSFSPTLAFHAFVDYIYVYIVVESLVFAVAAAVATISTTTTTNFAFDFAAACHSYLPASAISNKATQKFYFFGRNSYGACFIIIGLMRKRARISDSQSVNKTRWIEITKLNR